MAEDLVIGVVKSKGEYYKVDIQGPSLAILNSVSFDGATKRNKPNLRVGSLLYCRVLHAEKHLETCELTCCSAKSKKDWVTKESTFGELGGGYTFECSLWMCRKLLEPSCSILKDLGEIFNFEIAVGMNGRIWVCVDPHHPINSSSSNVQHLMNDHYQVTVLIVNSIMKCQEIMSTSEEYTDETFKKVIHDILLQNIKQQS